MPQHPRVTPGPERQLATGTAGRTPPRVTLGVVPERRTPRRRDRKRSAQEAPATTGAGIPLPALGAAPTLKPAAQPNQAKSRAPPSPRSAGGGGEAHTTGRPKPKPGGDRRPTSTDRSRLSKLTKSSRALLATGPAGTSPVQVTLEAPGWAFCPGWTRCTHMKRKQWSGAGTHTATRNPPQHRCTAATHGQRRGGGPTAQPRPDAQPNKNEAGPKAHKLRSRTAPGSSRKRPRSPQPARR